MADIDVTERSYPFSSGQGANVTEDDWSVMAGSYQDNGVLDGPQGTALTVVPGPTPNTIQLNPGAATIDGFYYRLTAPKILAVLPNPDTEDRVDLVSLHLDLTAKDILPVVTSDTAYAGLPDGDVPLSEWTQIPSTSASPTYWGDPLDRRWFAGSRMRAALSGSEPPAELGGFMHIPASGGTGTLYIGADDGGGGAEWLRWSDGPDFSVIAYGAMGDGTTNDAPAIQAALDDVQATRPGSTLRFPAGTYLINSELEIKGSIHLALDKGATIKRGSASMQYLIKNFNASYAPLLYAGRGGIKVTGGVIDANGGTLTGSVTAFITAHAKDVLIEGVTFRNVRDWHAVEINSTKDAIVRDCIFEGFNAVAAGRSISEAVQIDLAIDASALPGIGSAAFDFTPCDNVLVTGCTARPFGALGSFGRLVGSHSFKDSVFHKKIRIIGNHAETLNDYMVRGFNWYDAVVQGNTGMDCNGAVRFEAPTGATVGPESISITGNVFRNAGVQNNGAAVLTAAISIFGLVSPSVPVREVTITGNILKTFANATGVEAVNVADVVITGNDVKTGSAANCVGIDVAACLGNMVENNQVSSVAVGIKVRDATVLGPGGTITGNSIASCTTTGMQIDAQGTAVLSNRFRVCGSASKASAELNAPYCQFVSNYVWKSAGTAYAGLKITTLGGGAFILGCTWRGWVSSTGGTSGAYPTAAQFLAVVLDDANTGTNDTNTTYSSSQKYISSTNN